MGGYVGNLDGSYSVLLGAYDGNGALRFVGRTVALTALQGQGAAARLRGLERSASAFEGRPVPGRSRWDSHRFDDWVPLQPAQVCEVEYSRIDGGFIRHLARFVRWRDDKSKEECSVSELAPDGAQRP